jgi:hypothetical protein
LTRGTSDNQTGRPRDNLRAACFQQGSRRCPERDDVTHPPTAERALEPARHLFRPFIASRRPPLTPTPRTQPPGKCLRAWRSWPEPRIRPAFAICSWRCWEVSADTACSRNGMEARTGKRSTHQMQGLLPAPCLGQHTLAQLTMARQTTEARLAMAL